MADALKKEFFVGVWTAVLFRGLASLVFGILAFVYPAITVKLLVMIFGVYTLFDGAAALWSAVTTKDKESNRFWTGLQGVAGIITGVICLFLPVIGALYFILMVGFWYIFNGIMQIVSAIALRKEIENEIWLGLSGILSVVLGVAIIFYPKAGALGILWLIATSAIIIGVVLVLLALKLRKIGQKVIART
jgi:uncharacterized membrane protein HdeD (DUF308 family)